MKTVADLAIELCSGVVSCFMERQNDYKELDFFPSNNEVEVTLLLVRINLSKSMLNLSKSMLTET